MGSLNTKTKFLNIVVRKKPPFIISEYHDKILSWCEENCELYAFIYHKHDINLDGEVENEHLHLVATMKDRKLLSTFLNSFVLKLNITTIGVMIDKCNSIEGSLQYLLHKNDKNKTQHEFKELFYNYEESELKTILDFDCDSLTPNRLYSIIENAKSNFDIISSLGLSYYIKYRNVIFDIKDDIRVKKIKDRERLLLGEIGKKKEC